MCQRHSAWKENEQTFQLRKTLKYFWLDWVSVIQKDICFNPKVVEREQMCLKTSRTSVGWCSGQEITGSQNRPLLLLF